MAIVKDKEQQLKQSAKKNNTRSTSQESIPFIDADSTGILQTKPGCFTKMFTFNDISFTSLDESEQNIIYQRYMEFLNTLTPEVDVQLSFYNRKGDKDLLLNDISPELKSDEVDVYRKAYRDSLEKAVSLNNLNVITTKYLTIAIYESNEEKAMQRLEEISNSCIQEFSCIKGIELIPLTLEKRLELLDRIYKGSAPNYFFIHDGEDNVSVDFKKLYKRGWNIKDLIKPEYMSFNFTDFEMNGRYGQTLYLNQLPNFINTNFLKELCTQSFESFITIYINQMSQVEAINRLHSREMSIETEVAEKEDKANNEHRNVYIPHELSSMREAVQSLQDDIQNRDQKTFYTAVKICHFAEDKETLKEQNRIVCQCARKYATDFSPYFGQQERGLNSILPYGVNEPEDTCVMTTEELGTLIPFDDVRLYEKNGFYYGINKTNKSVIVFNRKGKQNMNGLVLGSTGSGKSMNCKEEILNVFFNTQDDIIIIDPDREYTKLAEALHGEVITIAPDNQVYFNPFDLNVDTSLDSSFSPIAEKTDYIMGLIETMLGNVPLSPKQTSILQMAINNCYKPYLAYLKENNITFDSEECPTFSTLFTKLIESGDPISVEIAQIIEPYVTGVYNNFSKRTNRDIQNRLIVFDTYQIGKTNPIMKDLALKVCTSFSFNKMMENALKKKFTRLYIDEFHLLLSSPTISSKIKEIWKRCRKMNGIPTGITQNVEDLLQSADARAIINNSYYKCIMSQSAMDSDMLREICHLSEQDVKYITNVKPGHGLICTGDFTVGFYRNMPHDNPCYELLNTTYREDEK